MISKTELVNKALTLVGAKPIVSIDDDTQNARIVNRVYGSSLKSVLSETLWNFATKRALLALVDDEPAWYHPGEIYVYQRPNLCIKIFGTNSPSATWREEGDYIYSDTEGLGVKYTYFINTPSKYPPFFTEAFVDKLCSDIAFMILNDSRTAEAFIQKYNTVSLAKAQADNAQIGSPPIMKDDNWVNSKFGGTMDRADLSYDGL